MSDSFESIIGHEAAVARMRLALTHGFPHALLITGPRHAGKATLAYALASALLETERPEIHPDFRLIERQADLKTKKLKKGIAVDEIRAVRDFLHLSAATGGRKVVIIDGAELLSDEAANALLKVLEEPPEGSYLILVAQEAGLVLVTIRSRAATLALNRVPDEEIEAALVARGVLPVEAKERANFAAGRPGVALKLGEDADVLDWYRREEARWRSLKQAPLHRRFALIAELTPPKEDREAAVERLRDLASFWEAMLRRELRSGSATAPPALSALSALARFRRNLHINIQPRLLLERLMLELDQSL
jgi:DNA polymerase-3 subunit delta'